MPRTASCLRPALILLLSLTALAANPSRVLLSFSLDDETLGDAHDDTRLYAAARGHVEPSTAISYSGYHSVEIRDVAGDGQFPELQGYFPLHRDGVLSAHFALLTTDARETFGVALAGPEWLSLRRDGIGFWLQGRGGFLYHFPGGVPRRLAPLLPFSWYLFDVVYRVAPGTYDLVVHEEGRNSPLVALQNQVNAAHQPGSGINTFSFTGDATDDASNVLYYVDDIVLVAGQSTGLPAGFSPERRKLYPDTWNDYRRNSATTAECPRPVDRHDLGVSQAQVNELRRQHSASPLEVALCSPARGIDRSPALPADLARLLEAASAWGRGCTALEAGVPRSALEQFDRALRLNPSGRIYGLSKVVALARLGRWDEVDARILELRSAWADDPRLPITIGMIAALRPDRGRALDWLQSPAPRLPPDRSVAALRRLWNGGSDDRLPAQLRAAYGSAARGYIRDALIVEQHFLALLWNGSFRQARSFSALVSHRLRDLGLPEAAWIERQGDASFLLEDHDTARQLYLEALRKKPASRTLLAKLADLCFRAGDLEGGRRYRQRAYRAPGSNSAP